MADGSSGAACGRSSRRTRIRMRRRQSRRTTCTPTCRPTAHPVGTRSSSTARQIAPGGSAVELKVTVDGAGADDLEGSHPIPDATLIGVPSAPGPVSASYGAARLPICTGATGGRPCSVPWCSPPRAGGWRRPGRSTRSRGFAPVSLLTVELSPRPIALWAVLLVRGYRPPDSWPRVVVLGLLEPAAAYLGHTLGLDQTSASNGAVLEGLESAFVVVLLRVPALGEVSRGVGRRDHARARRPGRARSTVRG